MRRLLLAGSMTVAALIGASTGAIAQVGMPDDGAVPQATVEARDITNQDIVDKAELDSRSEKRAKSRKGDQAVAATAADLVAGSALHDKSGVAIGTVDRVDADGVVVATTTGRVKVPLEAFGKNKKGLLLALTKAEFDQMVASAATGSPAG